jgi:hypothetical protein
MVASFRSNCFVGPLFSTLPKVAVAPLTQRVWRTRQCHLGHKTERLGPVRRYVPDTCRPNKCVAARPTLFQAVSTKPPKCTSHLQFCDAVRRTATRCNALTWTFNPKVPGSRPGRPTSSEALNGSDVATRTKTAVRSKPTKSTGSIRDEGASAGAALDVMSCCSHRPRALVGH